MLIKPKLADWLDPARLAPTFRQHGRMHLPDFFEPDYAAELARTLAQSVNWSRTIMHQGVGYDASVEALAKVPQETQRGIEAAMAEAARKGFQYDFETWRLSDALEAGRRQGGALQPLEGLYDFLNGETFLRFARTLTSDSRPGYCDAQATRYRAGHFLNTHNDELAGKERLYAYVINLTADWRTDWGGLLLFQDADGHVAEGYVPRFNALNIFRVPYPHCVSQVASFVTAQRLSITGWIRTAAAKPKPMR
jgi:Rps23 Pro-64 3,4-dihydroxylase Tpa1-like proline 4-hydroxylase